MAHLEKASNTNSSNQWIQDRFRTGFRKIERFIHVSNIVHWKEYAQACSVIQLNHEAVSKEKKRPPDPNNDTILPISRYWDARNGREQGPSK